MSNTINPAISEAGGDHAERLLRDLVTAAEQSRDPASFWAGYQCFISGAMAEHIGYARAADIQREAMQLAETNGQGYQS